ncbi:MAG: Mrp/NBP35 family ATP-binding protein [Culturomica sp.]|jgi:ATP-binding protein involved in chromosome partitioning|nr:Mrp/NBP35 family ATP-binding protein [Culturomica sp.]
MKDIKSLLKEIKYPGSSKDIIALDMVQNIKVEGDILSFRLVFQKSEDPFTAVVKRKCEELLRAKTDYNDIRIEVVFIQDLERPLSVEKVKNIVAISSGKGGVGKSTVAANLAVALVLDGYKVGLIDADIFGPSIPKMFGVEEERPYLTEIDGKDYIEPVEKYGVKLLSIGFFVDSDAATVWRGPMASGALKQLIEQGHWGELDFLLIDLPPGTSDIHLTLVQTLALTGAVVVTTPQHVALADAVKGINMFESPGISVPVLGIVENMSWFTPEELPQNRYYIFGNSGGKRLAEEKGLPLLGQIPVVQGICDSGDNGRPIVADTHSVVASAFMELAENLVREVESRGETAKRVKLHK